MSSRYHELVIEGPRGWALGFIQGFLRGRGVDGRLLDAEKEGFDCEPLREKIRELLHPAAETSHLLVPEELVPMVREALGDADASARGLVLRHERPIGSARFGFSCAAYSRVDGQRIRDLFENLPEEVRLTAGTQFEETTDPEVQGPGLYAPAHGHEFKGEGGVEGALEGVLAIYRICRGEAMIRLGPAELVPAEPTP